MNIPVQNPEVVAKRAFFLAYQASHVVGMGFLQAEQGVTEAEITSHVRDNKLYGDYVFGRMMKLRLEWNHEAVIVPDSVPHPEYQSWCSVYPTYASLIDAATRSL